MAKILQHSDPDRADYRMIKYILKIHFKGRKVKDDFEVFDLIGWVFEKMGGSWSELFQGGSKDIELLRNIIRLAIKRKILVSEKKVD